MSAPDDLDAWLRLLRTPGVGRDSARRLLAACGSPEGVFSASATTWRELVSAEIASALAKAPERHDEQLGATRTWLAGDPARRVLTLGEADYPASWLESPDPPLLVYLQGRAELLSRPALAVVGSRNPTAQGADNARAFQ